MDDDLRETSASLATLLIAGLAIAILLLWVTSAGAEVCLTKKQARELWPRQHLYWYSKDHCWSNRRGPPRGLKFDPVFSSSAQAQDDKKPRQKPAEVKILPADEFNEIDAAADSDTYFRAEPFPLFGSLVVQENFEMEWKIRIEGHLHP